MFIPLVFFLTLNNYLGLWILDLAKASIKNITNANVTNVSVSSVL